MANISKEIYLKCCGVKRDQIDPQFFDELKEQDPQITTDGGKKFQNISKIEEANLHPLIIQNLLTSEITKLTRLQQWAIPAVNAGGDVVVSSPTKSGKTVSYLLPILSQLLYAERKSSTKAQPFALIIAPTRELAIQITKEANQFAFGAGKKIIAVHGGKNSKDLREGCDVAVATLGRLLANLEHNLIDLSYCCYLVLDDADRYMEQQWLTKTFKDVYVVMEIYRFRCQEKLQQTLMFSATFPRFSLAILRHYYFMDKYSFIVFEEFGKASEHVTQIVENVRARNGDCFARLVELLREDLQSSEVDQDGTYKKKTLVFMNHKSETKILRERLANVNIPLELIGVSDYVHRIGRTAGIGKLGKATTFFCEDDELRSTEISVDLVKVLAKAQQTVPTFLQRYADRVVGQTRKSDNFSLEKALKDVETTLPEWFITLTTSWKIETGKKLKPAKKNASTFDF